MLVFLELLWPLDHAQELPQPIWHVGLRGIWVSLMPGEMQRHRDMPASPHIELGNTILQEAS